MADRTSASSSAGPSSAGAPPPKFSFGSSSSPSDAASATVTGGGGFTFSVPSDSAQSYDYLPSPPLTAPAVPAAAGTSQWLEPASSTASQSPADDDDDDVDSEATSSLGTSEWEAEQQRIAQEEWEEGIAQLQLAVQLIFFPFVGKWLGRKWSYWVFARYKLHGLTSAFWGLPEGAPWTWVPTSIVPDGLAAFAA